MLNRHCHGDVVNQRFVISPRTGALLACLSPKRQNLTTLASGEKRIFVPYSLKGLQFRSDYIGEVELHRPILDIGDRAKMSALFQLTPTFNAI